MTNTTKTIDQNEVLLTPEEEMILEANLQDEQEMIEYAYEQNAKQNPNGWYE